MRRRSCRGQGISKTAPTCCCKPCWPSTLTWRDARSVAVPKLAPHRRDESARPETLHSEENAVGLCRINVEGPAAAHLTRSENHAIAAGQHVQALLRHRQHVVDLRLRLEQRELAL